MYKFNDFQGETFAKRIYKSTMANEGPIVMGLSNGINTEYDMNYSDDKYSKFNNFAKAFIASGGIVSLASIIINGANFNTVAALLLSGAAITTEFVAIPVIRLVNKSKYISGRLDEEYNTLMQSLHCLSSDNYDRDLSDEEIHEMTESLNSGELETKTEFLSTLGKCPIIIWAIDGENQGTTVYYPINNLELERAYEVMMYVAADAEEGYEEYIKEGYHVIKDYVSVMEKEESTKEEKEAALNAIYDLESRIAKRGRK